MTSTAHALRAENGHAEPSGRRERSSFADWSAYAVLRSMMSIMQCFSPEQNLQTAGAIGSLYYRTNRRRRARAERNIALSFPDWPRERVAATAEASMRNMAQLFLVDALAMPRLVTPNLWPEYVRLGELHDVIDHFSRGRGAILVTGHCGNWELAGFTLSVMGFPVTALARPLDNRFVNEWIMGIREARGLEVITKWGATPVLQERLASGGRVGFIADQNAGDQGLFVPFFGRLASSYKSIGLLAMRYEIPIVTGHARRLGEHMRYELTCPDVIRPEDWVDQPDPLFYITARYTRAIEQMVRAAPEQYLWLHRRWKSRPKHERRGKPFPASLRRKLEQLPWMTEAELSRIMALSTDPDHVEEGADHPVSPAATYTA